MTEIALIQSFTAKFTDLNVYAVLFSTQYVLLQSATIAVPVNSSLKSPGSRRSKTAASGGCERGNQLFLSRSKSVDMSGFMRSVEFSAEIAIYRESVSIDITESLRDRNIYRRSRNRILAFSTWRTATQSNRSV